MMKFMLYFHDECMYFVFSEKLSQTYNSFSENWMTYFATFSPSTDWPILQYFLSTDRRILQFFSCDWLSNYMFFPQIIWFSQLMNFAIPSYTQLVNFIFFPSTNWQNLREIFRLKNFVIVSLKWLPLNKWQISQFFLMTEWWNLCFIFTINACISCFHRNYLKCRDILLLINFQLTPFPSMYHSWINPNTDI